MRHPITSRTPVRAACINDGSERSLTIREFCELEGISRTSYHKLQRTGLGPIELRAPGMTLVRITPAARGQWHERMAALQKQECAERERQRRSDASRRAGRKAAESNRHISKTRGSAARSRPKGQA